MRKLPLTKSCATMIQELGGRDKAAKYRTRRNINLNILVNSNKFNFYP